MRYSCYTRAIMLVETLSLCILYGKQAYICRLQSVQNVTARRRSDHIKPVLRQLHTGYRYDSASTSRLRRSFIDRCLGWHFAVVPSWRLPSCRRCSWTTEIREREREMAYNCAKLRCKLIQSYTSHVYCWIKWAYSGSDVFDWTQQRLYVCQAEVEPFQGES